MQQNLGKTLRVNDQIKTKEVRVVDENGNMIGVVPIEKAIKLAEEAGYDLVEVSPNAVPPVCKIANFGKMKYEMQKKSSDSKKKQKVIDTKEIKMSVNIGKNDYDVKVRQIIKFIEKGDKVKVSIKIKGREMAHLELADQIMINVANDTAEVAKFEFPPKMEGKQMIAIMIKK